MRILRSNIVTTCAVLAAMTLIYSQLCALNCALGGCIVGAKQSARQTQTAHSCHHHNQSSQNNDKQKDQKDCHSTAEVIAALPDSATHASIQSQQLYSLPSAIINFDFNKTRENPDIGLTFKSPPVSKYISVLRI
jgi:hypothetical protein